MKIYIGADHGGFHLKEAVEEYLIRHGYDVVDYFKVDEAVVGEAPKVKFT